MVSTNGHVQFTPPSKSQLLSLPFALVNYPFRFPMFFFLFPFYLSFPFFFAPVSCSSPFPLFPSSAILVTFWTVVLFRSTGIFSSEILLWACRSFPLQKSMLVDQFSTTLSQEKKKRPYRCTYYISLMTAPIVRFPCESLVHGCAEFLARF